mmetsp:Transcript_3196/g.8023  ORF Transcript_3196/g.8023 Transcript_3196/m.8023 type:complete len:205 (-) Transcript_3196:261-875(-)
MTRARSCRDAKGFTEDGAPGGRSIACRRIGPALPLPFGGAVGASETPRMACTFDRMTTVEPSRMSLMSTMGLSKSTSSVAFNADSDHFKPSHLFTVRGGPTDGKAQSSNRSRSLGSATNKFANRAANSSLSTAKVCPLRTIHSVPAKRRPSWNFHGRICTIKSSAPSSSEWERIWTATCRPSDRPSNVLRNVLSSRKMANCLPA